MARVRRGWWLAVLVAPLLAAAGPAEGPAAAPDRTSVVAAQFEALRDDPLRLRAFLEAMPKGGDLHNHLDGAVYAESFLDRAVSEGLCIDTVALSVERPPCTDRAPAAGAALARLPDLEAAMIDAMSMRDFVAEPGISGHDHFFATFQKFHAAASDVGASLAEEARRAAAEHLDYLEIMWLPHVRDAIRMGEAAAWHGADFAADLATVSAGAAQMAAGARRDADAAEARMREILGCGTGHEDPGCKVVIRFQAYSLRSFPPQAVFAQMAYDFALAQADTRFVGVNIVAPEDDPVALRDYTLHMRMLGFFHAAHPEVRLSLHAGELAFGLVPPEDLRFHIRQAVEIAGASRIGHGVSVMYEDDPAGLLAEMARRHVAVEINETSNADILGVRGAQHPFGEYRAAGVPVVISTDDAGVERTDMTHEYEVAVRTWHLGYRDVRGLAEASIAYSFLQAGEKAEMEARLGGEFEAFERGVVGSQ